MFMPDHPTARALLAFRAAHGHRWKTKLLFLWSNGRDVEEADGACLRQLRNQAGPAWLRRLSSHRWRAIKRLAELGDRQAASIFLDRAREFHEGARFGATVASAPALHLLAISCELGLKAYLMSRGWSHEEVASDIGHDLLTAFEEARQLGLPSRSRILVDVLTSLGPAYAAHRVDALVADGYVCDFAAALRATGSLLDAVAAGLSLPMPAP